MNVLVIPLPALMSAMSQFAGMVVKGFPKFFLTFIYMEKKKYIQLLQAVQKYYPLGSPLFTGWNDSLRKIIEDKIDGKSDTINKWENLIKSLRGKEFKIQNLSFLQFPNLMAVVEHSEIIDKIIIHKNFVICLSLLCPFYTYYYEYKHQVRTSEGLLSLNNLVFFIHKEFETLKISISIKEMEEHIQLYFPEYKHIYHYDLMMNKLIGGFPYGIDTVYGSSAQYTFYEFLFNNEQSNSVFS